LSVLTRVIFSSQLRINLFHLVYAYNYTGYFVNLYLVAGINMIYIQIMFIIVNAKKYKMMHQSMFSGNQNET